MPYSQTPLLELLRAGKVPGEEGIPEHIETLLSNVFLFRERVYKLYKSEFINKNFTDLSVKEKRFAFVRSDFSWNRQVSKEIYVRLQGVNVDGDRIHFVDASADAADLLIVMERLPREAVLFNQVRNHSLTESDYYEIGRQFAGREKGLVPPEVPPEESLLENVLGRMRDAKEYVQGAAPFISAAEAEIYADLLMKRIDRLYAGSREQLSVCLDVHTLNAFYTDRVLHLFDVFSPKDAWRFSPALLNIYRLATDVFALAGEKEFRAVLNGYFGYLKMTPPPRETEQFLVVYSAYIMAPYLYMLSRTDPDKRSAAVTYHEFLRRYAAL